MNAELGVGLIAGFLLGGVIAGVWIGTIAHTNYEKYMSMKKTAFGLEEMLLDAYEGNTDKMWMMRTDGVDVIVERGRPDMRTRIPEDDEDAIDLTWADQ